MDYSIIDFNKFNLIWSDEFNNSQLDMNKWNHRLLGKRKGAVNSDNNVELNGSGQLIISTSKAKDKYYTAMIGTENKFEVKYGYFEIRTFLPIQSGHWASFWLQSPDISKKFGNPAKYGVEVDIFEYFLSALQHAIHWDGYEADHKSKNFKIKDVGAIKTDGWNTFGLLWTKNSYYFYVNGKLTWISNTVVSQRKQYLIISLEVDTWAGDISKANLPDNLIVDYVRVYKEVNDLFKASNVNK